MLSNKNTRAKTEKKGTKENSISRLQKQPEGIHLEIWKFLTLGDLTSVARVSKFFKKSVDNPILWKHNLELDFHRSYGKAVLQDLKEHKQTYKKAHVTAYYRFGNEFKGYINDNFKPELFRLLTRYRIQSDPVLTLSPNVLGEGYRIYQSSLVPDYKSDPITKINVTSISYLKNKEGKLLANDDGSFTQQEDKSGSLINCEDGTYIFKPSQIFEGRLRVNVTTKDGMSYQRYFAENKQLGVHSIKRGDLFYNNRPDGGVSERLSSLLLQTKNQVLFDIFFKKHVDDLSEIESKGGVIERAEEAVEAAIHFNQPLSVFKELMNKKSYFKDWVVKNLHHALKLAFSKGSLDIVDYLFDLLKIDDSIHGYISHSVERGNVKMFQWLEVRLKESKNSYDKGFSDFCNSRIKYGMINAIKNGHKEMIEYLFSTDVTRLDTKPDEEDSLLSVAINSYQFEMFEIILNKKMRLCENNPQRKKQLEKELYGEKGLLEELTELKYSYFIKILLDLRKKFFSKTDSSNSMQVGSEEVCESSDLQNAQTVSTAGIRKAHS